MPFQNGQRSFKHKQSAQRTVNILQDICARFGTPETIISDNGTQFTFTEKFQTFCLANSTEHFRCPIFHSSSNVQAFVDTFKRGSSKIQSGGKAEDFLSTFLQYYRSTTNVPNKVSPAEALLGIRTTLDFLLNYVSNPKNNSNKKRNIIKNTVQKPRISLPEPSSNLCQ